MKKKTKKILKEFFKLKLIEIGMLIGVIVFFLIMGGLISSDNNILRVIGIILGIITILITVIGVLFMWIFENWEEAEKNVEKKSQTQAK